MSVLDFRTICVNILCGGSTCWPTHSLIFSNFKMSKYSEIKPYLCLPVGDVASKMIGNVLVKFDGAGYSFYFVSDFKV